MVGAAVAVVGAQQHLTVEPSVDVLYRGSRRGTRGEYGRGGGGGGEGEMKYRGEVRTI